MIIDTHVHTKGVSMCGQMTYKEVIDYKKKIGYGGMILTNHCQTFYFDNMSYSDYAEMVIKEYRLAKEYGDSVGFEVFYGLEVSVDLPHYSDIVLIGVTDRFMRETSGLCFMSHEELYNLSKKYGIIVVQAHPYRQNALPYRPNTNMSPLDPKYLDGIEINCKSSDIGYKDKVIDFAERGNLLVTCGTDFHRITDDRLLGLEIPDGISETKELIEYLSGNKQTTAYLDGERLLVGNFQKK